MAASLNRVVLMGNLSDDPVYEKKTVAGVADRGFCRFRLAVNRPYAKEGQQKADFIPCEAWGQTADFLGKYAKKGDTITVEGRWCANQYTNKDGKAMTAHSVVVESSSIVVARSNKNAQPAQGNAEPAEKPADNAAAAAAAVDEFDY